MIKKDLKGFLINDDKYSKYALSIISDVLYYVLNITEEISHNILDIDEAMKNGFGWKFGPFELLDKKSRPGRNPKTGEEVTISARRVVTFRAGNKLRKKIVSQNG